MKKRAIICTVFVLLAALILLPKPASATLVDLELSLLVDVSGSISASEFNTQRQGYVDAFKSTEVLNAIKAGSTGKIAVNLVYWSTGQKQTIGWTLVDAYGLDGITPSAFGDLIAGAARPSSSTVSSGGVGSSTDISGALNFAVPLFLSNDFDAARQTIDISGDGTDNIAPTDPSAARDAALAAGIDTINGIVIGTSTTLYNHYNTKVVGGLNPLLFQVDNFTEFSNAIKEKLVAEITPPDNVIPEPGTMFLLGTGLLGMAGMRRRKV